MTNPEPIGVGEGEELSSAQDTATANAATREPISRAAIQMPVSTAWVVLGSSGQWSDWSQWAICVCDTEQRAKDRVGELSAAVRVHYAGKPELEFGEDDRFTKRYERKAARWAKDMRAIDPDADEYDQPNYRATEVPFLRGHTDASSQDGQGPIRAQTVAKPSGMNNLLKANGAGE